MQEYNVYTDGASNKKENGGAGLLICSGKDDELLASIQLASEKTTNNQMESFGPLLGLFILNDLLKDREDKKKKVIVRVYSDSQYVTKGNEEWLPNWKRNGWKTNTREPIKNKGIWQCFDEINAELKKNNVQVLFNWVKGHNGHTYNEIVDKIAGNAYKEELYKYGSFSEKEVAESTHVKILQEHIPNLNSEYEVSDIVSNIVINDIDLIKDDKVSVMSLLTKIFNESN